MQPFDFFRSIQAAGLDVLKRQTEYSGDNIFSSTPSGGMPVTKDTALQLTAFWGSIRYISSSIAQLPWSVFASNNGGREEQHNHRIWATLKDTPAPGMTPFAWRETMIWNALVTGNALAEITPNGLMFLNEPVDFLNTESGELAYKIQSTGRIILSPDMFHLRGPSRDGRLGQSILGVARENLGLGLAAQTYGASFFGAGTHIGGVYQTDRTLTPDQQQELRDTIDASRGPGKAHRPRILTNGMTYAPDTIPPQDAQFLETRKYSGREIAQLFGVPPHKIGLEEGATAYASREQAGIEAVVDCLMPWTIRTEQEANNKLLTPRERRSGLYTKMNLEVHLRGDTKTRTEGYKVKIRAGVMTPNEARALEEMSADPNGNELLISRDMIPLSKIAELADSQIEQNATPATALAPLVEDAMACIKTRATQDRKRDRPPDKTIEFARLKLEPLAAAHALAELPFDLEALIDEGVAE